jgi:hypothetical protein
MILAATTSPIRSAVCSPGYRRCAAVLDDSIAAMLDAQSKP